MALVILIIISPALILLFALISFFIKGSPIFLSERVGHKEKPFLMLKFKTMNSSLQDQFRIQLEKDCDLAEHYARYGCLKNDPRVIRPWGAILRKYSIDELPQLVNVIIGNMLLVGPRPLPAAQLINLANSDVELRHKVTPGITGLWQVCGRSNLTLKQMGRLDSFYVKNRTVTLDFFIILKTIKAVLLSRGAF
ncbi:sugar transferase [Pseudidiomarina sp. PP-1MA]|uniref:Sugar transferase n=1 Tax=Pseudidiomarina sp. PP-1MA TaxID=3237706 RepID=A0AB39X8H6_9GAMM